MSIIYTTSAGTTWEQWTTSTTAATTDIYTIWCDSTSATSTTFDYWIQEYSTIQTIRADQMQRAIERQQQLEQQRQESERSFHEQQKQKQQARRKAKVLLLENLNTQQIKEYNKEGHFFVVSPSGRLYRIREGRSINIDLMKGNSRIDVEKRLCAHPDILCPNEDTMLAQKLYLENMEQEFLRVANQYDPVRH